MKPSLFKPFAAYFLLGIALAAHAKESLEEFAQQSALTLQGQGPWYVLQVPMAVRLASAHADLRDLRIFDSQGQALPYALQADQGVQTQVTHQARVQLFPLYELTETKLPTSAEPPIPRGKTNHPVLQGWLLDLAAADFSVDCLRLDWLRPRQGFERFQLQASDDLEHWQAWGQGQIARLSFEGEHLEINEVKLPGKPARYLRLIWPEDEAAAELKSAEVSGHASKNQAASMNWSPPLAAALQEDGSYQWQLPLALPLESIQVLLGPGQEKILAPVELWGRSLIPPTSDVSDHSRASVGRKHGTNQQDSGWHWLTHAVLYRLPFNGHLVEHDEIPLTGQSLVQLRLRVDKRGTSLDSAPQLRLGMTASRLIFMASDKPPYRLVFGRPNAQSAQLPPEVLIPGYRPEMQLGQAILAELEPIHSVTPTASTAPSHEVAASSSPSMAAISGKKLTLWAVLLAGVGLVAAMAISLVRSMGKADAAPK